MENPVLSPRLMHWRADSDGSLMSEVAAARVCVSECVSDALSA